MFLVWPLGGFFIYFQLGLLEFGLYLLVMKFFFQSKLLGPWAIWYWLWISWIYYVKIYHQILELLTRQRRDEYKIHLEASSIIVKINVYGLEFFRCMRHDLLSIISLTLIPYGWDFTRLQIMVHHHCTL